MDTTINTGVALSQSGTIPVFSFWEPDSITVLVNKKHPLPKNYRPATLTIPAVPFDTNHCSEKWFLRPEAAKALEDLFSLAAKDHLFLSAISGFRSYQRQEEIYKQNLLEQGEAHTNLYSAKPGCSEHQTGLAMDVSCPAIHDALEPVFGETKEGIWLSKNAFRCGFILRYPKEKVHITGYAYEPWHLRFVGIAAAAYLTRQHLTMEECAMLMEEMPEEID